MQAKERRQILLLAGLLAVLVLLVWWQLGGAMSSTAAPPPAAVERPTAARGPRPGAAPADAGPIVVHLAWLEETMPPPASVQRDPFVFGGIRPAAEQAPVTPAVGVAPSEGSEGPPEPPPPPPIPYRFIGLLEVPGTKPVAVLSDGRFVYHGREGDIIDGRYRLVSVSSASVQLEYWDGRGRQTLRLSGS